VVPVKVTVEMIQEWRGVLDEAEAVLAGRRLLPFWRDMKGRKGLNVRKVFLTPPRDLKLLHWIQGTAATPYLEMGKITPLADEKRLRRIERVFGALGFFGVAAWFN
jgi:hypothetical protein